MSKLGISDVIAAFINDMLDENEGGTAELQRSELASKFNCVPSQINYVISTRFSPERGYVVESRRGGGGYIRISKVHSDPRQLVMHTINAIGDELDVHTAAAFLSNLVSAGYMTEKSAYVMMAAVSDIALRPVSPAARDGLRASILKQMLIKSL